LVVLGAGLGRTLLRRACRSYVLLRARRLRGLALLVLVLPRLLGLDLCPWRLGELVAHG
jgi:hypothetical protein